MTPASAARRAALTQRGLRLECATLAWTLAQGKRRTGAALGNPMLTSEARHAWAEAGAPEVIR